MCDSNSPSSMIVLKRLFPLRLEGAFSIQRAETSRQSRCSYWPRPAGAGGLINTVSQCSTTFPFFTR
jgi:hypothetical protein